MLLFNCCLLKRSKMKKYLMILILPTLVACSNSMTAEELEREAIAQEELEKQRIIDSMKIVNLEAQQQASANNAAATSTSSSETEEKKGMSNKTKGALIGTGAGIVGGVATGAAVSEDKKKGAIVGGIIGGAVGSGVGFGVGAAKDKKEAEK